MALRLFLLVLLLVSVSCRAPRPEEKLARFHKFVTLMEVTYNEASASGLSSNEMMQRQMTGLGAAERAAQLEPGEVDVLDSLALPTATNEAAEKLRNDPTRALLLSHRGEFQRYFDAQKNFFAALSRSASPNGTR